VIVQPACDELSVTEGSLVNAERAPAECARTLARLTIVALDAPLLIRASHASACGRLLRTNAVEAEISERALGLLAAVAYSRPGLIGDEAVSGLRSLLGGPPLPETTYAAAGAVLNCLLATPAASPAIELLLDGLFDPDGPPAVYELLLRSLEYAAFWVVPRLDLAALVALAELPHLAQRRDFLLHTVIERVLFADPTALTPDLFNRLSRLYRGHPSWSYCLAYVAGHRDVPAAARSLAAVPDGQFPLQAAIRRRLALAERRVLMIQNIRDLQGDEIIRTVPLLEALLALNPLLEVTLVTARPYLYAHPRITLVPLDDRSRVWSALAERFDAVVDVFEPDVSQVNYDLELEVRVQAHVRARKPFLYLASKKGWGHFVYQAVEVASRPYASELGLDRQRVANNY